jgi:hypothetical protein
LYRFGNLASILEVGEAGQKNFNIFSDSPENLRKDAAGKPQLLQ